MADGQARGTFASTDWLKTSATCRIALATRTDARPTPQCRRSPARGAAWRRCRDRRGSPPRSGRGSRRRRTRRNCRSSRLRDRSVGLRLRPRASGGGHQARGRSDLAHAIFRAKYVSNVLFQACSASASWHVDGCSPSTCITRRTSRPPDKGGRDTRSDGSRQHVRGAALFHRHDDARGRLPKTMWLL